jgi:hypothetical protein
LSTAASRFSRSAPRADVTQDYVCRVSYLEIYQEQVKDLLDPRKGSLEVFVDEKVRRDRRTDVLGVFYTSHV